MSWDIEETLIKTKHVLRMGNTQDLYPKFRIDEISSQPVDKRAQNTGNAYNLKSVLSEFYNSQDHKLVISNKMNQLDLNLVANSISSTFDSLIKDREFIMMENKKLKEKLEQLENHLFVSSKEVSLLTSSVKNSGLMNEILTSKRENELLKEELRLKEVEVNRSKKCDCFVKYNQALYEIQENLTYYRNGFNIYELHVSNILNSISHQIDSIDYSKLTKQTEEVKLLLSKFNQEEHSNSTKLYHLSDLKKGLFLLEMLIREVIILNEGQRGNHNINFSGEKSLLKSRLGIMTTDQGTCNDASYYQKGKTLTNPNKFESDTKMEAQLDYNKSHKSTISIASSITQRIGSMKSKLKEIDNDNDYYHSLRSSKEENYYTSSSKLNDLMSKYDQSTPN